MSSEKTAMPFEARVYIQGVCVYAPDGKKLNILFPDQDYVDAARLRTYDGEKFCRHYAVVQFDRCNVPDLPDALQMKPDDLQRALHGYGRIDEEWSTLDLSGYRLSFEARPSGGDPLPIDLVDDEGRVRGIPFLPEVMDRAALEKLRPFDRSVLPGGSGDPRRLKAGFTVEAGVLSPSCDYEGKYEFVERDERGRLRKLRKGQARRSGHSQRREGDDEELYSTVLKLELGELEGLTLHFEPLSGDGEEHPRPRRLEVDFAPPCDELEIWVRHFCDLRRPDPSRHVPDVGDLEDVDFALNYALQKKLPDLLDLRKTNLPVPWVVPSWARGRPVSDEQNKCMSAQGGS